nr:response regulator [uncultured Desulfobacter sp.]
MSQEKKNRLKKKYDHTVLIVDDEEMVGKSLGRLLNKIGVKYVYMESGQAALEWVESAKKPFSLILSDQRMPGMLGSEFLERAKKRTPDTIRYLITGYSDIDAITDAVNKGSIHRYISKPWDNKVLIETIQAGLEQHELIMENHRLFKLAKDQNSKLYKLNVQLKTNMEKHKVKINELDSQITELKARLKKGFKKRDYVNEIELLLKENNMLKTLNLNELYAALMKELFEQFKEIATRNGFEMPESI